MSDDEVAFRLWCFLSGKGHKVPDFRTQFDAGQTVVVHPEDLVAMVAEYDLASMFQVESEEG